MGEKSQNKNKNSRVAQNFYIIVLNFMENDQKSKKLGTFYKFLHTLRAYFCLIFTSFWKKLIFAPPPGGGLSSRIFTVDLGLCIDTEGKLYFKLTHNLIQLTEK